MLSNTTGSCLPDLSRFCVKWGRNFCFNYGWLPSAQGSWSLSREILKYQLLITGRRTEVLTYSLEHLRVACCCYLVRNTRIQGRKNNGTPWNELVALKSWKLNWNRKEAPIWNLYFLVVSTLFWEFGLFWVCLSFCFQINNVDVLNFKKIIIISLSPLSFLASHL